jgi:hypothetical protein
MKPTTGLSHRFRSFCQLSAAAAACALVTSAGVAAQSKRVPVPAAAQKTFATAQEAADAFIAAAASFDRPALKAILGPDADYLVAPGEPAQDRETALAFAAKAREKSAVAVDPKNPNRATLIVGNEDWPLAIPIVRQGGRWRFDSAAGEREILHRTIGRNELAVIQICRGYVEAQHEYALVKREGSSLNQCAQRIISSPGKQDGLAWQNPDGTGGGPIGENVAKAIERGYTDRTAPYHGYLFKTLAGQGPAAPLGEMDFVVKGVMIGGFALVAAPAEYLVTGVKTFMVSHDGVVYEKDLGPDTLRIAKEMVRFNPDKTWKRVIDE